MKKFVALLALIGLSCWSVQMKAQTENKYFNHLAVGVGVSTLGIGVDAALPIGNYLALRAGVDIMPKITFNGEVDVDVSGMGTGSAYDDDYYESSVDLKGNLKRVQTSVLLNVYPFRKSSFFLAAGAYFGGSEILKLEGQSQELQDLYTQYGSNAGVVIGDYKLPIDAQGRVEGSIKSNNFRPYVGFGFGRVVPSTRLNFIFEMGVQLHGGLKVAAGGKDLSELKMDMEGDDDFSELMDKLSFYPVLFKLRLCGRIF